MPARPFDWKADSESLESYRVRIENAFPRRKNILAYEQQRFDEGWMFITGTTFKAARNPGYKPVGDLAERIHSALVFEGGRFEFDDPDVWDSDVTKLGFAVKDVCSQLNRRLLKFIEKYNAKDLLLDRMAFRPYTDKETGWTNDTLEVSWFLKRASR